MRLVHGFTFAAAIALIVPSLAAQGAGQAQETSRKVAGGGITVPGWTGTMDDSRGSAG